MVFNFQEGWGHGDRVQWWGWGSRVKSSAPEKQSKQQQQITMTVTEASKGQGSPIDTLTYKPTPHALILQKGSLIYI